MKSMRLYLLSAFFACIFVIFINVSCASKTSTSNSEQIEKSSEILTEESKENEENAEDVNSDAEGEENENA